MNFNFVTADSSNEDTKKNCTVIHVTTLYRINFP